ncbi:hypothetical protein E4U43_005738 [Claviceps pusilla]|uniref:SAM-dependent MTase RsmB/NOP-type domain-containing protein n=1 Tax=Claviceps pusilla TaxID=123648 RepID=A0A9P7N298_9HYPO|nr:hypothetical protein E4U43_005738 [Claviceps pusilla]
MSLYHEAADILSTTSPHQGGSLKSRVFGRKDAKSPPNQLYALVLETCKWSGVLKEVIEGAELLRHERKLSPTLALLLVHDLLLAKGGIALPQSHGLRCSIDRHKARLSSEFTRARLRRKAPSVEALRAQIIKATAGEEASHPRWVRVNALKSTIEEQLESTFSTYARAETIRDVVAKEGRHIFLDPHVPNLMAITPGHDLSKTEAYTSGKIILQDKASCFPAYLLDPRSEDGDIIDACAAPGNKTTHLASILHRHTPEFESREQTIFAFEKDARRAQTLEKMVRIAGAKNMTRIGLGQDFLQADPCAEKFKNVGALLLDPSCSGSGIVGRDSMPQLHLPEPPSQQRQQQQQQQGPGGSVSRADSSNKRKRKLDQVHADAGSTSAAVLRDDDGNETVVSSERDLSERLEALSSFQLTLLLHAFRFPSAKKVTYSTCSIHSQENEHVVMAALQSDIARKMGWRILRRAEQVSGLRTWPVRGLVEACNGDETVAEACIRTYKDDGHGVMGFFVAAFARDVDGERGPADGDDGPYVRDDGGRIVRDMLGMPVLKATGLPVALVARDKGARLSGRDGDDDDGDGDDGDGDDDDGDDDDGDDDGDDGDDDDDDDDDEDGEDGEADEASEWGGFED